MKHLIYRYPLLKRALLPISVTRRYFLKRYVKRERIEFALASGHLEKPAVEPLS